MIISRSLHIIANGIISYLLWVSNIPVCVCVCVCVCVPHPLYPSVDGQFFSMSWILQTGLLQNIGMQDVYFFHPKDDTSKLIS